MWGRRVVRDTGKLSVSTGFQSAAEELSAELANRWHAIFASKNWAERLNLLQQVHEQLQEDLRDFKMYCAVSPRLIRRLIELVSDGPVGSLAQAHIYANSDDERHRRAAGEWLNAYSAEPAEAD
jgi:hypothetical protein